MRSHETHRGSPRDRQGEWDGEGVLVGLGKSLQRKDVSTSHT